MSRPAAHRWQVVGESSDPVPGDPEQVAKLGRQLRDMADTIKHQAKGIEALDSVKDWKGKTAGKFREDAGDTAGNLRKAFKRYDEAARALGTRVKEQCGTEYASELHRAQQMADKALRDAENAGEHGGHGKSGKASQKSQHDGDKHRDSKKPGSKNGEDGDDDAVKAAKKAVEHAKGIRDNAAKKAASAIRDVIDDDGLKDGWRDKFKNWVKENSGWLHTLSRWAGRIALWAGVAALALGWIPVIGQVIAAVANAVALIASVAALATDLVLALGGEGGWDAVILDAVGVATFGIGRAAVTGAKGASAGGKALARSNLYKAARATGKNENKAWKIANRGAPESARGGAAAKAMASTPKGRTLSMSSLKEGFSPKSMYHDTVGGTRFLKNRMPGLKAPTNPTTLDPDLARAAHTMRTTSPEGRAFPAVQGAERAFSGHAGVWAGSTATGVLAGYEGAYSGVTKPRAAAHEIKNDIMDL